MPITSDIILNWAIKAGQQHIARARDREQAVIHLGVLPGYELDE